MATNVKENIDLHNICIFVRNDKIELIMWHVHHARSKIKKPVRTVIGPICLPAYSFH